MSNFPRSLIQLALFMFLAGCLTPYEIKTMNAGGQIVIDGYVSTLDQTYIVEVGITTSISRKPFPANGAQVTLYDDQSHSFQYTPSTRYEGQYELNGFQASQGVSYFIEVILKDGRILRSYPEKVPAGPGSLTTEYGFERKGITSPDGYSVSTPYVDVYVNALKNSDSDSIYLKWDAISTYIFVPTNFPDPFGVVPPPCFVTQKSDPQRINLAKLNPNRTTELNRVLVARRFVNYSFITRHYFTVYQSSLTFSAYDYWRKADLLTNRVGSVFDTPPAPLIGNIYNVNDPSDKPLGYFQATNSTFSRFFLIHSDIPNEYAPDKDYCTFRFDRIIYPDNCLDCSTLANSSYVGPDWF